MKYIKKLIYLLLTTTVLSSCYSWGGRQVLGLVNNSEIEVSFYPYSFYPISLKYGSLYPDTVLKLDTLEDYSLINIQPHCRAGFVTSFNHRDIKKGMIPFESDTLMFFLFSTDTLKKYSWEEIKRDYKVLKRYDITGGELNKLDWTLTYP